MAKDDTMTLVVDTGNYFRAPTGTERPADLSAVPEPDWENVGNTSLEDILALSSEGGEATVLGTLQNKSLRTRYSKRSESMTFTLQQFDTPSLKLYYGANAPTLPNGDIGVPLNPQPTVCAFLVIFIDADNVFAFYAPKAEIYRSEDMSLSGTEDLAGLPLSVTPLAYEGNDWTYAVTPLDAVDEGDGGV